MTKLRVATPIAILRGELLRARDISVAPPAARLGPTRIDPPPPWGYPPNSWRRWAACKTIPTAAFYPGKGDTVLLRAAVAVCTGCGVRERCLEAALAEEAKVSELEVFGIRGGMTAAQRLALSGRGAVYRRRRQAAAS